MGFGGCDAPFPNSNGASKRTISELFGYSPEKPPPAYGAAEMTKGDRIDPTNPVHGQRGATNSLSHCARSGATVVKS